MLCLYHFCNTVMCYVYTYNVLCFVYPNVASQGVLKFWETFGYISNNWKDPPSDETKFLRKRLMNLPTMIQCGK